MANVAERTKNGEGDPAFRSQRDLREHHGTNSQRRKAFPITFPITHSRDFLGPQKKDSWDLIPQRSGVLFPVTSSECSSCSAVRSRRTGGVGSADRPGFGCPQAIKKAAGSAASNKGSNASKTLDSLQRHHPDQAVSGAVDAVYELPKKKRGPTPSQFDALPLHRRSTRRITRFSPTGRRHYDQTTPGVSNPRKSRGPTLCQCSTHCTPLRRVDLILAIHAFAAIRRSAH